MGKLFPRVLVLVTFFSAFLLGVRRAFARTDNARAAAKLLAIFIQPTSHVEIHLALFFGLKRASDNAEQED
jgi:hypothetical protein